MSNYIKILIIIILLKPILSGIVFGKNNEKYVNFVIGLIIISLLMFPLTDTKKCYNLDYSHDFEKMNYEELRKNSVKSQIEERLNSQFKVDDVVVILDDNFNIIDVSSREQIKIKEYLGI